tara:strand:+ start:1292 stop:1678 length:387 start_codon:yes stop_codon:yes gene_type:complete
VKNQLKKHPIISNFLLSCLIVVCVLLSSKLFKTELSNEKYFSVVFFFIFYAVKQLVLSNYERRPQVFVSVFGLFSFIKLALSAFLIIAYYLSNRSNLNNSEMISFVIFFGSIYFIFLVFNIITGFTKK